MAATYEPIATYTVSGSSTNTITFNSIPGTYTDLVLTGSGGYTWSDTLITMQVNNDSGSNYYATYLTGDGSTASSARDASGTYLWVGWYPYPRTHAQAQTDTGSLIINFMNYANTNMHKTMLIRNGTAMGNTGTRAIAARWASTSAITSIKLYFPSYGSPNFSDGSKFTLYGIKAA